MGFSLKNFLIKRIAVVEKGDNKGAEVLLFKSDPEETIKEGGAYMKTFEELMKELPEEDRTVVEGEIEKVKTEAKTELEKAKAEMTEEQKKKMEEEKAIAQLQDSINSNKFSTGITDVWRSAAEGRGRLLLVEKDFFLLVKTAFNQRRKMLRNAVKELFEINVLSGKLFDKRAEQLSVQQFADLTFMMK